MSTATAARAVILENGVYRMWISVRYLSSSYRMGYAESTDGEHWKRDDAKSGLELSESGWDSEMVCLASIAETQHDRYIFYNGNNYGETGFGVAVYDG